MFNPCRHGVAQPRRPSLAPLALALAAATALAAGFPARAAALGLEESLRLAEAHSRSLLAHHASAEAARHMAVSARQRPDPMLTAGLNNLPVTGADRYSVTRDFMTARSVGVKQQFTRGAKLEARGSKFEREADVAEATHRLAVADLRRETALAWLDRQFLQRALQALVAQRDEAQLQVEGSNAAYRGGKGSQADVLAARTVVEQLEDRLLDSRRQLGTADARLARWTGVALIDTLGPLPPLDDVPLHEATLATELERHPQIERMRRREAVAVAEAEVARAERKTDFSVEVMYSQRGPAYSNMVSVNVSVPLQWNQANRQQQEVQAKLADVEALRLEREEALRSYVLEARTMIQTWRSLRARVARYASVQLPLAAERTRAALAAYRGGSGPLAAVLQAREGALATRLEQLRLETDAARLWAQLAYLMPPDPTAPVAPAASATSIAPATPSTPTAASAGVTR